MVRRTCRSGLVALCVGGFVLASAGCGVLGHPKSRGSKPPVSASASASVSASPSNGIIRTGYVPIDTPLQFDILGLGRVNAHVVAMRIRLSYTGPGTSSDFLSLFTDSGDAPQANMASGGPCGGLMLVDGTDMKAYHPLSNTSDGGTAETGWASGPITLGNGQSLEATILYPTPPAGITSVDVEAHELTPILDVPLASGYRMRQGDPDPNGQYNPPYIQTLNAHADSLDNTESHDRHGKKVDIRLNADVLFKFDKYRLTPKADAVLQDVATQVDKAKATTIHVDGYTDNVGDQAYNQKLSEHRAAAVLAALKKLVTRQGITYTSAGHGENDPVATNDSAQGRQKNRRVTVTLG